MVSVSKRYSTIPIDRDINEDKLSALSWTTPIQRRKFMKIIDDTLAEEYDSLVLPHRHIIFSRKGALTIQCF
jgi:hypothetical protein